MQSPVTIGLSTYNCSTTIERCLQSIFAQSFTDWSLVIVDDGSTDGTSQLLLRIDDPRVRVLSDGLNLGLATRLNQIAELATGKLLARMDGDDMMHPDRLKSQLSAFDKDPSLDLCSTEGISVDADDQLVGYFDSDPNPSVATLLDGGNWIHPAIFGVTQWFRGHPYKDSLRRAEDQELWLRTYDETRVHLIRSPLMFIREVGFVGLDKYRRSIRATQRNIITCAHPRATRLTKARALALSEAKLTAYRLASLAKATDRLVALRSSGLSEADKANATVAIDRVTRTRIPGWAA